MSELVNFFLNHWILSTSFLILFGFYLGFELLHHNSSSNHISPSLAIDLMNHQHAIVIDLRNKELFDQAHIINAINIPQEQLMENVKKLQKYAKKPMIVVCAAGKESPKIVAKLIKEQGFLKVLQLAGGMHAWVASGYPVVKSK